MTKAIRKVIRSKEVVSAVIHIKDFDVSTIEKAESISAFIQEGRPIQDVTVVVGGQASESIQEMCTDVKCVDSFITANSGIRTVLDVLCNQPGFDHQRVLALFEAIPELWCSLLGNAENTLVCNEEFVGVCRDNSHDWIGDLVFALNTDALATKADLSPLREQWSFERWSPIEIRDAQSSTCSMFRQSLIAASLLNGKAEQTGINGNRPPTLLEHLQRSGLRALGGGDGRSGQYREPKNASEANSLTSKQKMLGSRLVYSESDLEPIVEQFLAEPGVLILRHGQKDTDPNIEDKNKELTQNGVQQTAKLANKLGKYVDMVWTSDLRRCFQTAQLISDITRAKITHAEFLSGPTIKNRKAWNEEKAMVGWSNLFSNWASGAYSAETIQPLDDWLGGDEINRFIQHLLSVDRSVVIGQGIVTQSLCQLFLGRVEFSGDGLCGFYIDRSSLATLLD